MVPCRGEIVNPGPASGSVGSAADTREVPPGVLIVTSSSTEGGQKALSRANPHFPAEYSTHRSFQVPPTRRVLVQLPALWVLRSVPARQPRGELHWPAQKKAPHNNEPCSFRSTLHFELAGLGLGRLRAHSPRQHRRRRHSRRPPACHRRARPSFPLGLRRPTMKPFRTRRQAARAPGETPTRSEVQNRVC